MELLLIFEKRTTENASKLTTKPTLKRRPL